MNKKQTIRHFVAAWMLLPSLVLGGIFFSSTASADPAQSSVKCKDGKSVEVRPDFKPNTSILDDKDYNHACRNNGGYRSVDETIICNDGKTRSVFKDAADPKNELDDKDREKACQSNGGIKEDINDMNDDSVGGLNVDGNDCGGVETAIIKCDADNSGDLEDNGVWGLLIIVLNVLTAGVGILAVGGIVYGAILYTTAEDKADQVKKATDIITNVVIGLVFYALMWAGLNFIVPGGVFA